MLRLFCFLALAPGLAMAGPFDGTYRPTADSGCGNVGLEGGALKISDGIFFGVGMQCMMTRPVDVVDMDATLYTMECAGEGESWSERAMLMEPAEKDGILMIWNGYAFRYERCTEDEIAAAEDAEEAVAPAGDALPAAPGVPSP